MSRKSDRNRTGIGAKRKRTELKKAYELGRKDASRPRQTPRRFAKIDVRQALIRAGGWISRVEIDGKAQSNFYPWVKRYNLVEFARDLRRKNPREGSISEQDVRDALIKSGGVLKTAEIPGRDTDIHHYLRKYELHEFARDLRARNPMQRKGRPRKFTADDVREILVKCNGSYTEAERLGLSKATTLVQRTRQRGLVEFAREMRKANPKPPISPIGRPAYDDIAPETALDAFKDLRTVNKVASALSCTRGRVLRLLGEALAHELHERGIDLNTWLREETRWNVEATAKKEQIWKTALESLKRKAEQKNLK